MVSAKFSKLIPFIFARFVSRFFLIQSGAILAVLIYTCMRFPDARLSIIFLPWFTFSAESAVYGLLLFDAIGLLLGLRLFDHAAHLGGALFGLWYATYGEELYRRRFQPWALRHYLRAKKAIGGGGGAAGGGGGG